MTMIDALNLSVRTYNCLVRAGIRTVDELSRMSVNELKSIRNLRESSMKEILEALKLKGVNLRNEDSVAYKNSKN